MVDGHSYLMACEAGDEPRLTALGAQLDATMRALKSRVGDIGERRVAVMAALSVLDTLEAAEARVGELEARIAELERAREEAALATTGDDDPFAERLDAIASALERLTGTLTGRVHATTEVEPGGATFGRAPTRAADRASDRDRAPNAPRRDGAGRPDEALADEIIPAFARRS